MSLEELSSLNEDQKCIFCGQNMVDDIRYGPVYKYSDIITHYFCLLFSSNLEQNGEDDKGILGFLERDIRKEVRAGSTMECSYCHNKGATIVCCYKMSLKKGACCKTRFHYPCGIQNGSLHLFYNTYSSFCYAHRHRQYVPKKLSSSLTETCAICQEEVEARSTLRSVWAPCCKTKFYHRLCIQRMAVTAGYFFKCPNCNNQPIFRREMLECGIYIPDSWSLGSIIRVMYRRIVMLFLWVALVLKRFFGRNPTRSWRWVLESNAKKNLSNGIAVEHCLDGLWELEPNAYHELLERHSTCNAEVCLFVEGRDKSSDDSPLWKLILCDLCGSQGIHLKCGGLNDDESTWNCSFCSPVMNKIEEKRASEQLTNGPDTSAGPSENSANETITSRRGRIEVPSGTTTMRKRKLSENDSDSDTSKEDGKRKFVENKSDIDSDSSSNFDSDSDSSWSSSDDAKRKLVESDSAELSKTDRETEDDASVCSQYVQSVNGAIEVVPMDESVDNVSEIGGINADSDGSEISGTEDSTVVTATSRSNEVIAISDSEDEEDMDDVIFVGTDISNVVPNDGKRDAIIRIVENNAVLEVLPSTIRNGGPNIVQELLKGMRGSTSNSAITDGDRKSIEPVELLNGMKVSYSQHSSHPATSVEKKLPQSSSIISPSLVEEVHSESSKAVNGMCQQASPESSTPSDEESSTLQLRIGAAFTVSGDLMGKLWSTTPCTSPDEQVKVPQKGSSQEQSTISNMKRNIFVRRVKRSPITGRVLDNIIVDSIDLD